MKHSNYSAMALTFCLFSAGCSDGLEDVTSGTSATAITATDHGTWNLETAQFPGSGYYSGLSSSLGPSDVCSGKSIFGSPGSAVCLSGTASSAALASHILPGYEGWDAAGNKLIGSYGGVYSNSIGSMAYRIDNGTVDLSVQAQVDARVSATIAQEVSNSAVFTSNHYLVPNPRYDTDGRYSDTAATAQKHYLVTVKGRPTVVCGLDGVGDLDGNGTADETEDRVRDCATRNTAAGVNKALWEGSKYGMHGEGDWKLVTLYNAAAVAGDPCAGGAAGGCYEVWRDERTKLVWSDRMTSTYNWFQAAGYARNATTAADTLHDGGTPTSTGKAYLANCPTAATDTCQPDNPISVCADAAILNAASLNGINTYTTPAATNGPKGNLSYSGTPSVVWRLPTIDDWKLANVNGIRRVLPNMDFGFNSATSVSNDRSQNHYMTGDDGFVGTTPRNDSSRPVRCVGR